MTSISPVKAIPDIFKKQNNMHSVLSITLKEIKIFHLTRWISRVRGSTQCSSSPFPDNVLLELLHGLLKTQDLVKSEVATTHFLEQLLKLLAHSRENHKHWFDSVLLELTLVTSEHISFDKLLLCYKWDFLQWMCVALLCFVSQNRRALQDKEESCTGHGQSVLRQWPGPATAWAAAWDRSQVKPESEVRLGLEPGRYETGHSQSCNTATASQKWEPARRALA